MRRAVMGVLGAAVFGAAATGATIVWPIGMDPGTIGLAGNVDRGAYLARASGTIACRSNFGAGRAPLDTPFGTFCAPSLTTGPAHGIGNLTVETLAKAVRQGIAPDGNPYFAAFRIVPPVAEPAPPRAAGFPFDHKRALKLWRNAFFHDPQTEPIDGMDDLWYRGRELVRKLAGGRSLGAPVAGNDSLPGGSMGEVVTQGTRFLSPTDREAIATHLIEGENAVATHADGSETEAAGLATTD